VPENVGMHAECSPRREAHPFPNSQDKIKIGLMKFAARSMLGVIFAFALLAASACGGSTSSSGTGGNLDPPASMPSGFPSDVPIYPGARLTGAVKATIWIMQWETIDDSAKVQAFYSAKLNQGDWVIRNSQSTTGGWSASFSRKTDTTVSGTLALSGKTGITKIVLSL
jgi:hypothetical protein